MNHNTPLPAVLPAEYLGDSAPSEFWQDRGVLVPVLACPAPRPVFHESGYASGHAAERITCPGLLAAIERLAARPECADHVHLAESGRWGWAWCLVVWPDGVTMVFLTSRDEPDTYAMSN